MTSGAKMEHAKASIMFKLVLRSCVPALGFKQLTAQAHECSQLSIPQGVSANAPDCRVTLAAGYTTASGMSTFSSSLIAV